MKQEAPEGLFSAAYASWCQSPHHLGEEAIPLESALQELWHEAASAEQLTTREGHAVRVVAPGWWNRMSGPDFRNAQIEFNGVLHTGDVEIHLRLRDWFEHGHHLDPAYNDVLLHVVRDAPTKDAPSATTQAGRALPTLVWPGRSENTLSRRAGACANARVHEGSEALMRFLDLAGEWRLLEKARRIAERAEFVGDEQALYEAFMSACGYSRFKAQFQRIAEALPYARARQLAQQDPLALEAAFLRLGGLLPLTWPHDTPPPQHYGKMLTLLDAHLAGLGALQLHWSRAGSRPTNAPERRLSGAARFITRTADPGLKRRLALVWRQPMRPLERRRALEALFGGADGFWARHCAWNGTTMTRPGAPLGSGRIRSIIGNVLAPAALAWARGSTPDRPLEQNVHALVCHLPGEPVNHIHRKMTEWLMSGIPASRLRFRCQQGLIQLYNDWCARNPSCRDCAFLAYLEELEGRR